MEQGARMNRTTGIHTYNGWTNRETWLVNLWFNPESSEDVSAARETIENAVENLPNFLKDFVDTESINWAELFHHFDNETEEA